MQRQQRPSLCKGSLLRLLPCLPKAPKAMARALERSPLRDATNDPISTMQIRMLKTDASPMKKQLAKACSRSMQYSGSDVWLHIYDLGPLSKWFLNSFSASESGFGAFHAGVEVLGVEWSFQAMLDCEE